MKYSIFALLVSLQCVAAVPTRVSYVENLLKEIAQREVPGISKIQVQNLHVSEDIPNFAEITHIQPSPPIGYVMFESDWMDKGKNHHASGNATVKVYARVAVARNPIRHGDAFTEDNIKFEEREISTLKVSGYYSSREALSSMRARGYLAPNAVIGFSQAETPLLVTPGQVVELINEGRHLRVTAKVKAMESGKMDQWIKVENPTTKRILMGKVIGSGQLSLH